MRSYIFNNNMKNFEIPFETEDFESLLNDSISKSKFEEGQVLSGKVIKIEDNFAHVDVGLKSVGKIPMNEFSNMTINAGDSVDVVLTSIERGDGSIGLSHDEVRKNEVRKQLEEAFANKEKVSGFAFAAFKSGYKVSLSGITAFLPRNQIDTKATRTNDIPLNVTMSFIITSMDNDHKGIIVSLREAKDIDKKAAKKEFIEAFSPGQMLENCMVKNVTNYGAFIDIGGGYDGLLHITDMSWRRLHHPSQAGMEKGVMIPKAVVLKVDKEAGHISLGVKQLQEDPWVEAAKTLKKGQVIKGKVTNVVDYGAFIEIGGIEGLVHASELSWKSKNVIPSDIVQPDEVLNVEVLAVDPEKRRVSLSVKNCIKNPWSVVVEKYTPGTVFEGTIKSITPFGLSVEVQDGICGMVHNSDLSWTEDGNKIKEGYKADEKITVKVLSVIPNQNKIKLGVKQLSDNPFKKELDALVVGGVVSSEVIEVLDTEIEVILENGIGGFIKKSEFSKMGYEGRPRFKVGDKIPEAQIVSIKYDNAKVELSIRKAEEANYKANMKEFKSHGASSATLSEISGKQD